MTRTALTDSVFVALAPLLVVAFGGLGLMLTEVLSKRPAREGSHESGPSSDLALATFITMVAGAVVSLSLWLVGPETLGGAKAALPFLVVDRFTLFFDFVLCLGAGLAALTAGGYLP